MTANELFDSLPSMKFFDGKEYNPVVKKDCDGYVSAFYVAADGSFRYANGAGYGTIELALEALSERIKKPTS